MATPDTATAYCANLASVRAALARIEPFVKRTPALTCASLSEMAGVTLLLKGEAFQRTGSFKIRGAMNAVLALKEREAEAKTAEGDRTTDVVTHSSGNHAQAVALAAASNGLTPRIVMPHTAPGVKRAAVEGYGGIVTACEPTLEARAEECRKLEEEHGAHYIHASNDPDVISGQGTIFLELYEQAKEAFDGQDLDAIIVPVGGGGMISGIALAARELQPDIVIIGAEPARADDAYQSKTTGEWVRSHASPPDTIADGLLGCLAERTWPVVRDLVDTIVTVDEDEIRRALRLVWQRAKVAIEPSGAVGVAAVLSPTFAEFTSQHSRRIERVGVVLCGGNVDLGQLAQLL